MERRLAVVVVDGERPVASAHVALADLAEPTGWDALTERVLGEYPECRLVLAAYADAEGAAPIVRGVLGSLNGAGARVLAAAVVDGGDYRVLYPTQENGQVASQGPPNPVEDSLLVMDGADWPARAERPAAARRSHPVPAAGSDEGNVSDADDLASLLFAAVGATDVRRASQLFQSWSRAVQADRQGGQLLKEGGR